MPSVLILGAGLAGLTTARALAAQNFQVTILDKGRGVGGRLATRRMDNGRADHGAQYFSATTPEFRQQVTDWKTAGIVREWHLETAGVGDTRFNHPRYIGTGGMSSIAKHLADGLDVRTSERVVRLRIVEGGWLAETESGNTYPADAVCCTLPAPQALTLLTDSGLEPEQLGVSALATIHYQPGIAVMAVLTRLSGMPAPGAIRFKTGPVAWVADNQQKGISPTPSVTIHASAEFSRARLDYKDADVKAIEMELLNEVREWIAPDTVKTCQIHRWRYSLADVRYPDPLLAAQTSSPLLFGGDGFGMGNVEGAFLSGRAMANRLVDADK